MKKVVRKNQIIITALAIMIIVAGYLNFTGQEISTSGLVASQNKEKTLATPKATTKEKAKKTEKKQEKQAQQTTTDISAEDDGQDEYTVNDKGEVVASKENPGEAVMVSNRLGSDYFASAKLSREQNRAKNKETLMEVINNKSLSSKDKKAAVKEVAQITKTAEKENAAELMLEAKGFANAVVSITGNKADVVVNGSKLSSQEMAQIEDIVVRKTNISPENIVITPVKVEENK